MPKKPTEVAGKFGKLQVLHCNLPPRKRVLVRCECGKEFAVTSYDLLKGRSSSCGDTLCSTKAYNLLDKKFGFLYVESLSNKKNNRGELIWICKCDCGRKRHVKSENLLQGFVKSCGCQKDFLRSQKLSKDPIKVAINGIYNQYKANARKRKVEFSLSSDQFKEKLFANCYYCNALPIGEFRLYFYANHCF
jgi:hypothetical protein